MKILVYGAGVIGSIFAGKLAKTGYDITVLARGNENKNSGICNGETYNSWKRRNRNIGKTIYDIKYKRN